MVIDKRHEKVNPYFLRRSTTPAFLSLLHSGADENVGKPFLVPAMPG
jgi:hypothetical protein